MLIFYSAVFESLIRFGITAWFGSLTVQLKSKLLRLRQVAFKIMGVEGQPTLQAIFDQAALKLAGRIVSDPTHVLHGEYQLLPSGRRYRVPMGHRNLNRLKKYYVPLSIKLLNEV